MLPAIQKLRAPAPSAAHAPRVAETVSSSMSVARAEQSASAVRAASVASSRPGGSDDSPLTSVATASPLSKRGYALAARPLPPRRAMSSPLGAFGARPSGLQHGRQLSSAVGALVDAAMVTSPITGHVVPWSVAQFETLINCTHAFIVYFYICVCMRLEFWLTPLIGFRCAYAA